MVRMQNFGISLN
jgi:hypothetical protein